MRQVKKIDFEAIFKNEAIGEENPLHVVFKAHPPEDENSPQVFLIHYYAGWKEESNRNYRKALEEFSKVPDSHPLYGMARDKMLHCILNLQRERIATPEDLLLAWVCDEQHQYWQTGDEGKQAEERAQSDEGISSSETVLIVELKKRFISLMIPQDLDGKVQPSQQESKLMSRIKGADIQIEAAVNRSNSPIDEALSAKIAAASDLEEGLLVALPLVTQKIKAYVKEEGLQEQGRFPRKAQEVIALMKVLTKTLTEVKRYYDETHEENAAASARPARPF